MQKTAKFDDAKHAIAIDYDRKLIATRYSSSPIAHVRSFYMQKRAEFSQMRHVVGGYASRDLIMSDA